MMNFPFPGWGVVWKVKRPPKSIIALKHVNHFRAYIASSLVRFSHSSHLHAENIGGCTCVWRTSGKLAGSICRLLHASIGCAAIVIDSLGLREYRCRIVDEFVAHDLVCVVKHRHHNQRPLIVNNQQNVRSGDVEWLENHSMSLEQPHVRESNGSWIVELVSHEVPSLLACGNLQVRHIKYWQLYYPSPRYGECSVNGGLLGRAGVCSYFFLHGNLKMPKKTVHCDSTAPIKKCSTEPLYATMNRGLCGQQRGRDATPSHTLIK